MTFREVLLTLALTEMYEWLPYLAEWLVKRQAAKLPEPLAARLSEEWSAYISDAPGHAVKLTRAVELALTAPRMHHEYSYPNLPYRPASRMVNRTFNIAAEAFDLVFCLPILVVVAATSWARGRPALQTMVRVGMNGREIRLYRFRLNGHSAFDRFLMRTGLGELPLLLNVVRGDLNLVGPIAWSAGMADCSLFAERLAVHPGLTSFSRLSSCVSVGEALAADALYVRNWSFSQDLKIMAFTIAYTLFGTAPATTPDS